MNNTEPTGSASGAPETANPQARIENALGQLSDEWTITATPGVGVTCTRDWPDGSVDTVLMLPDATAQGRRDNAAQRQVWTLYAPVEQVLQTLDELEPPGSPDAPTKPIRDSAEDL